MLLVEEWQIKKRSRLGRKVTDKIGRQSGLVEVCISWVGNGKLVEGDVCWS